MRLLRIRPSGFALCLLMASACCAPRLFAQDPSQPPPASGQAGEGRGGGRGQGMGGGIFGAGMNGNGGSVTAISGNEITIKNEQGETWKVLTSPNTHFRKDREEAKISDIRVGDTIMAAGNLDDGARTIGAVFVVVLTPEQAARMQQMRATFGKTWTTGKITAVNTDALTLTIERPDKLTQVVAVDENTTFHERGQDITFPDIKVGDMMRAEGAVQGANFLAKNVMVMEPRGPGRPGGPPPPGTAPQPQGASSGSTPAQPTSAPQN